MTRLFIHDPDQWATGYYRAKLPVYQCYSELSKEGIELHLDTELQSNEIYYHAYMFTGMPTDSTLQFIRYVKEECNRKLVWSIDDDLFHFPMHMPNSEAFLDKSRLQLMTEMADLIFVSTPNLARQVNRPEKTKVLPILMDESVFAHEKHSQLCEQPLRVLWCGSMFHEKDLELLVAPLMMLMDEYKHKIQFIFWGYLPDNFASYKRVRKGEEIGQIIIHPRYQDRMSYMNGLKFRYFFDQLVALRPHIGLAPLEDNEFNSSKSCLKYLEYSMVGAAVIASDVQPYRCIENQVTGLLASGNTTEAWYDAIKMLVDRPHLRQELANNALDDVRLNHTWKSPAKRQMWLDAFRAMAYL